MAPTLARLARSARNRAQLGARRLRGRGLRALSWLGVLSGAADAEVGRGVALEVYGELVLGRGVILDDGCKLAVSPGARLVLGDGCYVGRGAVLAAGASIEIGAGTLIAEHCTVRDSDHPLLPAEGRYRAPSLTAPVRLGRDVWLGAGGRVLKGVTIGDGAVVGANAVVTRDVPPLSLAAGVPAKVLRKLEGD